MLIRLAEEYTEAVKKVPFDARPGTRHAIAIAQRVIVHKKQHAYTDRLGPSIK